MDITMFDSLPKLIATLAILGGGYWILIDALRNGARVPRLQVGVAAEIVRRGDQHFITATCQAKNVGRSVIRLAAPGAGQTGLPGTSLIVRILRRFAPGPQMIEAPWDSDSVSFDVFTSHHAIGPGLTISEQKLICQPDLSCDAAWVQLNVSADDEKWSAVAVAVLNDTARTQVSTSQTEQTAVTENAGLTAAAAMQAVEQKRPRQKMAASARPRRGQENRGTDKAAEGAAIETHLAGPPSAD